MVPMPSSGKMRREKGKVGEREVAKINREHGFDSQRGVQYHGGSDSPDVVGIPGLHLEVKRVEKLQLWPSLTQAQDDCGADETPVVVHRPNRRPWIAVLGYEEFLEIYKDCLKFRGII